VVIGEKENQAKMKYGQVEYSAAGERGAWSTELGAFNAEPGKLSPAGAQ
jgi:hypothetical protein